MPSSDDQAKSWQLDLSARTGQAIQKRRKALRLSAQQLAQRTVDLGYPVTRVAISKIEANVRQGKFDVAEWLVLAQALEIPPVLLILPGFPDEQVEGLPGVQGASDFAASWISGLRHMGRTAGTELTELVERRAELRWELDRIDRKLMPMMIASRGVDDDEMTALKRRIRAIEEQQETIAADIERVKMELWGE